MKYLTYINQLNENREGNTMNTIRNTNRTNHLNVQPLTQEQLESTAGGGKGQGQAIVDFIAWVACGFNHHYVDTGKTKVVMDGPIPTRFKQVKCKDCGHKTWQRVGIVGLN